ncbi:hypothetical protein [Sphingobium herbicidovorans]|uniref:hypothetical protein n=1 Tax=Sphingobium herbicidovorans TaxID=76947 RepID=UPI0012E0A74E|nr:hypothetical protein [Sphingobium herbicidovorans]
MVSFLASRSKRTNFLSVGVTLCALIAAICAAPLAFVEVWIAAWLLALMTILVLGTFGIWAFHAVKNPRLLDTEQHLEQMAAIPLLGSNQINGPPIVKPIIGEPTVQNPNLLENNGDA